MPDARDPYDPTFIRDLFDEMSRTYVLMNLVTSFGFSRRWRRQCVRLSPPGVGAQVVDLMAGMGEMWPDLACFVGPEGAITAVDISPVMCEAARRHGDALACPLTIHLADALACPLADESADMVYASFGLKTFSPEQCRRLADEVARILKPGGGFALVEISVPNWRLLRGPYLFYLRRVIPLLGRLMLGNPDNYRMLGIYTTRFGNCAEVQAMFQQAGLETRYRALFFGCASAIIGRRP